MLIDPTQATLLVIDVQEKLIGAVSDPAGTLARTRWLLAATVWRRVRLAQRMVDLNIPASRFNCLAWVMLNPCWQ